MNKHLMFASVAVIAALASCSNNDTVEEPKGQAIGFKSMIDKNQSRAAATLTTDNLESFKVWGYAAQALNFNGQEVNKTNGVWGYTPEQYWEVKKAYAFTAVGSSKQKNCTATFEVPAAGRPDDTSKGFGSFAFNNKDVAGGEDLCYAIAEVEEKAKIDNTITPVDLAFQHALARVKFTFENALSEAYKLTVKDIKINNAAEQGTFDVAKATWTNTGTFALTFDEINTAVEMNGKGATGYQYILPGAQTLNIDFTLEVEVGGVKTSYTHSGVVISLGDDAAYIKGNSYNFTATIDKTNLDPDNELIPIVFNPTVSSWDDVTDEEKEVDVKPAGE